MANDVTHGHYAFHEKAIASNIADHKSPQAYRYRANSFKKALREDTTVKTGTTEILILARFHVLNFRGCFIDSHGVLNYLKVRMVLFIVCCIHCNSLI